MHRLLLSVVFIVIAVIGLATLPWSLMNGPAQLFGPHRLRRTNKPPILTRYAPRRRG